MKQLTWLIACLLMVTTAQAAVLPMIDANGPTAGRVTVDNNGAQPSIRIRIDDRHRSLVAGWYLFAFSDGLWWQRSAEGGWVAWRGDYGELQSLGTSRPEIVGYPIDLSELPGLDGDVAIYAGYQLVDGAWVFNENPAIIHRPTRQISGFERETWNQAAYIPPQCYTDTISDNRVYNPCFACHTESRAPNYINDSDLQTEYSFPKPARMNPWVNLFRDRSMEIAAISDANILHWVRQDNYPRLSVAADCRAAKGLGRQRRWSLVRLCAGLLLPVRRAGL